MKLLIILGLSFGIMVGLISPRKAGKTIARMLIAPAVLMIAWSIFSETWQQSSLLEQVVIGIAGSVLLLAVVLGGTRFGREVLTSVTADFLYDVLKSMVRFPMRLFRFLFPKF